MSMQYLRIFSAASKTFCICSSLRSSYRKMGWTFPARARDAGVLGAIAWADFSDGAEGAFARFPQFRAGRGIAAQLHADRVVPPADIGNVLHLRIEQCIDAVDLGEDQCLSGRRKSEV